MKTPKLDRINATIKQMKNKWKFSGAKNNKTTDAAESYTIECLQEGKGSTRRLLKRGLQ